MMTSAQPGVFDLRCRMCRIFCLLVIFVEPGFVGIVF